MTDEYLLQLGRIQHFKREASDASQKLDEAWTLHCKSLKEDKSEKNWNRASETYKLAYQEYEHETREYRAARVEMNRIIMYEVMLTDKPNKFMLARAIREKLVTKCRECLLIKPIHEYGTIPYDCHTTFHSSNWCNDCAFKSEFTKNKLIEGMRTTEDKKIWSYWKGKSSRWIPNSYLPESLPDINRSRIVMDNNNNNNNNNYRSGPNHMGPRIYS